MSLRSSRSWMPARKSCASRIIGLRLVRAIAVSTSISTLASEPWTISTSTGSALGAGVGGQAAERELRWAPLRLHRVGHAVASSVTIEVAGTRRRGR